MLGALQPDRRFRAHHRSRDPDRQQHAQRRGRRIVQAVRLEVRQRAGARDGGAGPQAQLPRAAPLCRELRAADSRLLHALARSRAASRRLARRGGRHRDRQYPPGQGAQVTRRGVGETARLRETQTALRFDRQCVGLGGHLRELLFPEAGRLALSVPGESDHRRDCRPGLARLREPGRPATRYSTG